MGPSLVQRDIRGMFDVGAAGMEGGCSRSHRAAPAVAGMLGFVVILLEVCHFRKQVLMDGGGARAWITLLVALGGVLAMSHDASVSDERAGGGAVKLMAALIVAHVAVPLFVPPPPLVAMDDEDVDDDGVMITATSRTAMKDQRWHR